MSAQADAIAKSDDHDKATVDNHYLEQRGKNADVLRAANEAYMKEIREKTATPIKVARFAAEYHALKKRQAGHGSIWRFFHSKENAARNQLLADMKSVLDSVVREDMKIDDTQPWFIASQYSIVRNDNLAKDIFKADHIAKRCQLPENAIQYEPTSNERASNDKSNWRDGIVEDYEIREQLEFPKDAFVTYDDGGKEIDFEVSSFIVEEFPSPIEKQVSK
jgi:hypothetical protein